MALNHISIMGRLTADPELKTTPNGVDVTSFTIASDRDYGTNGEKQADFFDVVAWRNTAKYITTYFTKGRMIIVAGRLQTRTWTDKDGNKRKAVEIVADNAYFGDSKKTEDATNNENNAAQNFEEVNTASFSDDDLPF